MIISELGRSRPVFALAEYYQAGRFFMIISELDTTAIRLTYTIDRGIKEES